MSTKTYDVVVLGGGIGGYTAAIKAAQAGKSTALVERAKLGGTCLHQGCIPSKALLKSAEIYHTMQNSEHYGVIASGVTLDFKQVQQRKQTIVETLYEGLKTLMRKNGVDVYFGNGRVIGPSIFSPRSGSVAVEPLEGESGEGETLVSNHLIVATGSRPRALSALPCDGERILNSDQILRLERLPASIVIVGGGVIGVEWASMLHDFGVEVTVIEAEDRLLPLEDRDVSTALMRAFQTRGIAVLTNTKVQAAEITEASRVKLLVEQSGQAEQHVAACVLVAAGRQANVEGIGLENTDVALQGAVIRVNRHMQTTEPHIYAIGDVTGGLQLAHAAAYQAAVAVSHLLGDASAGYQERLIPRCVYTRPETASLGLSEMQAKEMGHAVKVGRFPFAANGKAQVQGATEGFVKVIADRDTQDILGVHMIGSGVTELIGASSVGALLEATPWEMGQAVFAHPTLSEIVGEANLAVDGKAIGI